LITTKKAFLLSMLPLLAAFGPFKCSEEESSWRSSSFTARDLSRAPSDVRLPRELWEKIEELGRFDGGGGAKGGGHGAAAPAEHGAAPAAEHGAAAPAGEHGGGGGHDAGGSSEHKPGVATVFAPLRVYLTEKNPGILRDGNTKIEFGPGGGEIDFRDLVEDHNGSFYFIAEFVPDLKDAPVSVFFMSNGIERKIGAETFGAGCKSYFNISTAFDKALKGTGFLVNTTEGRHVAALAGNYFFAAPHEGKLYLASLTIKDSGHKSWQCKRDPAQKPASHED
jgi:hypothetical protein